MRMQPCGRISATPLLMRSGLQGIKITDAASKKKARDTLEAEAALRKMDVESNLDWEEAEGSDEEQMED